MIIKSHIRGGYRAAADYLKDVGKNEKIRLVEISDLDAKNLDKAFHNMWVTACNSKVKKPIHHISINPFKDERLTDAQVQKIVERAEQKYGYKPGDHQRVIVEHILNGRQHFHVMWSRVSLTTGKAVWPGQHWNKSKQTAREMEKELRLKTPVPRRGKKWKPATAGINRGRTGSVRAPTLERSVKKPAPKTPSESIQQSGAGIIRVADTRQEQRQPTIQQRERYATKQGPLQRHNHEPLADPDTADLPSGRAEAAYKEEYDRWQGLIETVQKNTNLSPDQRAAAIHALRQRQQEAAQGVRRRIIEEEKATARAARRARRILLGLPVQPS